MAVLRPGNRSLIAYSKREAFICTNVTHPSKENCKSDDYRNTFKPEFPLPLRLGEFAKTITILVDFGPLKWLTAPAEIPPEFFIGLPSDFITTTNSYYLNPEWHAVGENYTLPGYGKQFLNCSNSTSCWIIGLGMDELGYMVPMSDFRVRCMFSEAECKKLPLTYPDSMSGKECKWVVENVDEAKRKYGSNAPSIIFLCTYALMDQAKFHYDETNSFGWGLGEDWINAVKRLVNK